MEIIFFSVLGTLEFFRNDCIPKQVPSAEILSKGHHMRILFKKTDVQYKNNTDIILGPLQVVRNILNLI
jgi:hypothetical protein